MSPRDDEPRGPSDLEDRFNVSAGLGNAELRDLVAQVLGVGPEAARALEPAPSRRRPPPAEPATYLVTIDLDDADPPIWRQLAVPSDLRLDAVHAVLQVAMGWSDSHLHEFALGSSRRDPQIERFGMADDVDDFADGEPSVPETDVQLDELLQGVGDTLLYTYDFGDGWDHTLRLDAVLPRPDGDAPPRCTDGARACPPEDCGGVGGYEELLAGAADPTGLDPDGRAELDRRLAHHFPAVTRSQITASAERFEPDEVDALLARPPLPKPLAELLGRAHGPGLVDLLDLIERAGLDGALLIDTDAATRMVEPFAWLLGHVGEVGLPLTVAGYLRPSDVAAVAAAIGLTDEWIGAANRESQTYPVLAFRKAAQKLGLLRVTRGRVCATRAGARLAPDPVGLWWHIAARLPISGQPYEHDAGLVALLRSAAGADRATQAAVMTAIGWRRSDGEELSALDVQADCGATATVLERMGVFARSAPRASRARTTREGAMFARAALRAWP